MAGCSSRGRVTGSPRHDAGVRRACGEGQGLQLRAQLPSTSTSTSISTQYNKTENECAFSCLFQMLALQYRRTRLYCASYCEYSEDDRVILPDITTIPDLTGSRNSSLIFWGKPSDLTELATNNANPSFDLCAG